jgi:CheY-like chemotaxis protein
MKGHALQVLLVEDNAGDARLLREMLSEEKPDSFELKHLLRMHEAETHLAKGGSTFSCWTWGCRTAMALRPCAGRMLRPPMSR